MKQKSIGIAICLIVLLFAGLKLAGVAFGENYYIPSGCNPTIINGTLIGYNCGDNTTFFFSTTVKDENCVPLNDILDVIEYLLEDAWREHDIKTNLSNFLCSNMTPHECRQAVMEIYNHESPSQKNFKEILDKARKHGVCK